MAGRARLETWLPYQAALAGLSRMAGDTEASARAIRAALALHPAPAERLYLERRLQALA